MKIELATDQTILLGDIERSKFGYGPLSKTIERQDIGEDLVHRITIEAAGILCEPYWEMENDIEGDSYHEYIKHHRDFTLSVRKGVLDRLIKVQSSLPSNWHIILKAGYRPYSVQLDVLKAFIEQARADHPNWSERRLQTHGRTFVADPEIVCPPHVTGGAVDIDIRDRNTHKIIDFGCPPNNDTELAFLHSNLITEAQYTNRIKLLKAMLHAGFAPFASEWWHYQYGETYWAAFYGHKTTKYDLLGYNER